MHFSSLISQLPVLAALMGTAAAVDLQAFQGSGCDVGASVYWSNVQAYTCVTMPLSFGTRFINMPGGAQGQAYYDSHCTNFAQAGGSGTYCLDAHNNMRSANWFWTSKKLVRREEYTGETTTGLRYTTPDGETRSVSCPASQFEHVLELVKAEDWAALAVLPDDPTGGPKEK